MGTVLSISQTKQAPRARFDDREVSRKLELIEDRPDSVLTWGDVTRQARALWRRRKSGSSAER